MGRKVAVAWHASFSIAAGVLYFFFVLPRWPELMGTTSHTLGTVLRIVTGAVIGLAALPVVFTLLRTRKPELGTPQLALSLRTSSIGLHVLAGVLIIGTAISEIWLNLDTRGSLALRHLRRRGRDRAARHLRVLPRVRGRAAAAAAQTAQAEGGEEKPARAPQGRRRMRTPISTEAAAPTSDDEATVGDDETPETEAPAESEEQQSDEPAEVTAQNAGDDDRHRTRDRHADDPAPPTAPSPRAAVCATGEQVARSACVSADGRAAASPSTISPASTGEPVIATM